MNMLNRNCKTSFAKPEFLKKAQRANPRLYDIGCYNDNLALMLAPESDEMIRLDKESRSKLSDLIKSFDYDWLNNIYDLFVPQREKSPEQHYFPRTSKMSHTSSNNEFSKESFHLRYFNSLEHEVDTLTSQLEIQQTQFLNEIDRLSREYYYVDHMNAILGVYTDLDEVTNLQCDYLETVEKLQRKDKNDKSFKENQSNVFLKEREQYFEIQDLKAQLQDKGIAISELKKLIEKMKGKSVQTKFEKSSVIRQPNVFKSQRHSILGKPAIFLDSLAKTDFSKSKSVTTQNVSHDFSKPVTAQILPQNVLPIIKNTNVIAPGMYKVHTKPNQTRTQQLPQDIRKTNKRVSFSTRVIPTTSVSRPQLKSNQLGDRVMSNNSQGKKQEVEDHRRNFKFSNNKTSVTACNDSLNAKTSNVNFLVEIILFIVDSGCSKHMTGNLKLLTNFMEKFLGTGKFGNDQIAPILSYRDLFQGTITIKHVYYVEGLNHNLFSVGQFCDADLEVAFQKSTCYIRDLKGNDLLTGSRGTDLYSITLQDSTTPNPICLMAKATSSQAWLWHRRLSHLNFDTINLLSKNNIVNGLPKLKFVKDHLCSSCELGKAKRKSFHTKTTPSSKRRLQLLHMDLCGPMREKKQLMERNSSRDCCMDYSDILGSHFLMNRTLVEAARTMLSAAKVPLFFWAEAIAKSCFTQKTVHLDGENLDKMKEKGDACIFVGYSTQSKAYRVFNKRTRIIVEIIHVNFDKLPQMALDHVSSDPIPQCSSTVLDQESLSPDPQNSDHAGCLDSRKSTSGGIQFLGGDKLVRWSAEAEYCDSKAAIAISCNPVQHSRTKHIDVRYHFINEQVEKGIVELFFVGTEYQLSDLFTKALSEDRFKYLVRRLEKKNVLRFELENPVKGDSLNYLITGLDDGVAASFQRSRIHKPHAHTHAFKVNRSTSRSLILNFPTIKEPQSQIKNSLFGEDC
ncbi:retrovirus-related pol polyprotein from transposon TNT 1-94 [Tanacetum coccineum]